MKQLIVNADGFGFTFGNNKAILEVLEHGFVRSVSVNVTWPAVGEVPTLMHHFPHVSIGVHLNLSVGPPILPPSEVPSLVKRNGEFYGAEFPRMAGKRLLEIDEMKKELHAQIRRLRELGAPITHWDSHQGRHLYPGFFEAALEVTQEENILITRSHKYYLVSPPHCRKRSLIKYYAKRPRRIITHFLSARRMRAIHRAGISTPDRRLVIKALSPDAPHRRDCWMILLQTMPEGLNLMECHPGYVDDDLRKYASLLDAREKERELLSEPGWLQRAKEFGVECVNHATVKPST